MGFRYSLSLLVVVCLCFVWCDTEEGTEKPLSKAQLIQRSYKSCRKLFVVLVVLAYACTHVAHALNTEFKWFVI